jgi:hypothetical protein
VSNYLFIDNARSRFQIQDCCISFCGDDGIEKVV